MIGNLLFTNYPAVRDIISLSSYIFKMAHIEQKVIYMIMD